MKEESSIEVRHVVSTCDVPGCRNRLDRLVSDDLWRDPDAEWEHPTDKGWDDVPLRSPDGSRTVKRLVLCPEHADLVKHYALINLIYGAVTANDTDRLPLEI